MNAPRHACLLLITGALMVCGCQHGPTNSAAYSPQTAAAQVGQPASSNDLLATALLERINADLLASTSATLTLEKWCADHDLASPAAIVVEHTAAAQSPASDAQRDRLQVGPDTEIRYRNVKLKCGAHTLSEAENWYVPSRLTAQMNEALTQTTAPYGKVIRPLAPRRQTFALDRSIWLNSQLAPPASPAQAGSAPSAPACEETVFSHSALVLSGDNLPLAEVRENYKMELVCFASTERLRSHPEIENLRRRLSTQIEDALARGKKSGVIRSDVSFDRLDFITATLISKCVWLPGGYAEEIPGETDPTSKEDWREFAVAFISAGVCVPRR